MALCAVKNINRYEEIIVAMKFENVVGITYIAVIERKPLICTCAIMTYSGNAKRNDGKCD